MMTAAAELAVRPSRFLSMGVPYLLPSIAVALVGGSLATGGRGYFLGIRRPLVRQADHPVCG
jgi:ribose/xylose/arabinose/galactoside ABC-type transport system permease subunit